MLPHVIGNREMEEARSPSVADRLLEDTNTSLPTGTGRSELPAPVVGGGGVPFCAQCAKHRGAASPFLPDAQQGPSVPWTVPPAHHLLLAPGL